MITAVDTSVLLDVFGADKRFGADSAVALRRSIADGGAASLRSTARQHALVGDVNVPHGIAAVVACEDRRHRGC